MSAKILMLIQLKTRLSKEKKTATSEDAMCIENEIETIDEIISDLRKLERSEKKKVELMGKLVVRGCFRGTESKEGRNYKIATQTFREITGLDYETEIEK